MRNRLKVIGILAPPVTAKMIHVVFRRNRTLRSFISNAVSGAHPSRNDNYDVPFGTDETIPADARRFDAHVAPPTYFATIA